MIYKTVNKPKNMNDIKRVKQELFDLLRANNIPFYDDSNNVNLIITGYKVTLNYNDIQNHDSGLSFLIKQVFISGKLIGEDLIKTQINNILRK